MDHEFNSKQVALSTNITEQNVWSTRQIITIITFAISITFYVTMIYNRFLIMEQKIETLEERLEKKDTRSSLDRKNIWEAMQNKQDK